MIPSLTYCPLGRTLLPSKTISFFLFFFKKVCFLTVQAGMWSWEGWGCVCYSSAVRYTITIWSCQNRQKTWGVWVCVGVHPNLLQSYTVESYGYSKSDTSPGGVDLRKKPKNLRASETLWERGTWVWGGCEYRGCTWKCIVVWCGMFTKDGLPSLTVNHLRDPAGMSPRPTMSCHIDKKEKSLSSTTPVDGHPTYIFPNISLDGTGVSHPRSTGDRSFTSHRGLEDLWGGCLSSPGMSHCSTRVVPCEWIGGVRDDGVVRLLLSCVSYSENQCVKQQRFWTVCKVKVTNSLSQWSIYLFI